MRPIHLSVSGLHSFREKQEVHFDVLCKGGVFGIFGPTGSGKSSILDAVTLALYGKVERASNTIQGIMNHAEKQLNVTFTFELGHQANGSRYRVERTYRRTKNDSIRTSTCRLINLNQDPVVIADKERDLTNQIEKILGLTSTDFTRAVVLPQGKFAEFLSLKGTDRRQMLQRLFHLEQYGDKLNSRLKVKAEETRTTLKEIVAEQQGLGNASEQALMKVEEKLVNAIKVVNKRNKTLQEKEICYERYRQVWAWQGELKEIKNKLSEHATQVPFIEELKQKLIQAKHAHLLLPYLEDMETVTLEEATWSDKRIDLKQSVQQSRSETDKAQQRLRIIQDARSINEPTLYEQLQALKYAKELEQERRAKSKLLEARKKQWIEEKRTKKMAEERLEIWKDKKEKAQHHQLKIKKELEGKSISFEERNQMRDALSIKRDLVVSQGMLRELTEEKKKREEQQRKVVDVQEKEQKQQFNLQRNIRYFIHQIESSYNRLCEHERVIEQAKVRIATLITHITKKQKEAEIQVLSVEIAKQLSNGKECPVCGSLEHPHPASNTTKYVDYTQLKKDYEKIQAAIQNQELVVQHCKQELQHLFETFKEYIKKEEIGDHEIAAGTFDSIEDSFQSPQELMNYLNVLQTETKGFRQDVIELKEKRIKYAPSLATCEKKLFECESTLVSLKEEQTKIEEKITEYDVKVQSQQKLWQTSFVEFPFDSLEDKQNEMDRMDIEVSELNERYETSVKYLTELSSSIEESTEHYQSQHIKVTKLTLEVSELENRVAEIQQRIRSICGERPVDEVRSEVETELEQYKKQEGTAQEKVDYLMEKLQRVDKELDAVIQSQSQAEHRLITAKAKWKEKLSQTPFHSITNVKDFLVSNKQQLEWEEGIEQFTTFYLTLQHDQKRLENQLQEKTIDNKEWSQIQIELEEAKSEKEAALSEKAKLEEIVDQLKARVDQFRVLETKRIETEELAERLGKLQAVFRGNSFVEFIAEEQLIQVARDASKRLGELTRQRYAIEVDSTGGFVIRDDANGGGRRPVSSLSGGETFLTSLALALALSAQIQLQGEHPLEFFFLDEGFGTLDQELLETVITALERLQMQQLSVGVISHVPELRARLPRRLVVESANPSGKGSAVRLEVL